MKLHDKQIALLDLLSKNSDDPLTIRELMDELDLSSPSLVHHHIKQLEKKGYLKRDQQSSNYQVLASPEAPVSFVNLYGLAQCGPNGTLLSGNPSDRIPLSSQLIPFQADQAFLVQANGKSMEPDIQEGDLVICQKNKNPRNGDIVICALDGEAMIKKFRPVSSEEIILESTNTSFNPIIVHAEDRFQVEGVFRGLIRVN